MEKIRYNLHERGLQSFGGSNWNDERNKDDDAHDDVLIESI